MIEPPSLSQSTTSLLVGPVGFRPNSLFYGFQLELDQLEQKLENQKRGALGTCAVLLWGPPGCGKSQIAREYLWRHRGDYPAGCFWVDCRTSESRFKSFWEIAQAVAILGIDEPRDPAWDESSKFVDAVRKWFEAREGWLLVMDGVTTDNDDDIQALVPFIPDRSGNNIIYTSVDRTLAKRQRLLNPAAVKVFPLSQQEARALLYKHLGIKEPNALQAKKATQLVKHYECLPLAVHAAAHALIARGTSLDKFSPGTSDHRLAEPFLEILSALRDHSHPEAVNLVTLLSFFAHTVPVALLRFGQPALLDYGVEIRSVEQVGTMRKELDNTIAVLIRYGLVERTLLEYSVPSPHRPSSPEEMRKQPQSTDTELRAPRLQKDDSSSLDAMIESPSDGKRDDSSSQSVTYSIDIVRIHSVVQSVLRDELKFRFADQPQEYWWWLSVASRMLCHSYTVADSRIRNSKGRGLVRDYRDYETHAARLLSHFPKSSADATPVLRKTRHNLHETMRTIKKEIQNQSPSQSLDSLKHRVQASVFERANSTSSESPESDSGMTRTSTWTLGEQTDEQTESPIQMHHDLDMSDGSEGGWTDRWSQSGMENSKMATTSRDISRLPSESGSPAATPTEASFAISRRSSVLQAIFQGRPQPPKKPKDLGEWKPVPVPPTLSNDYAKGRSRASSFTSGSDERTTRPTSTGSEASAALAAVHRVSPPVSRAGRIRSPTRPQCIPGPGTDGPLSVRSPNTRMWPLATEFQPGQSLSDFESAEMAKKHSRHPSSSPRLMQTALNNQAAMRIISSTTNAEIFSFSRPPETPPPYSKQVPIRELADRLSTQVIPEGYSSQPMSRDTSRESNVSLATAPPAVPGSASLSTSPQIREPYLYSRPGLASIDLVAANPAWDFTGGFNRGTTETTSPIVSGMLIEGIDGAPLLLPRTNIPGSVQFGQMSPVEIDQARTRASILARERNLDTSSDSGLGSGTGMRTDNGNQGSR